MKKFNKYFDFIIVTLDPKFYHFRLGFPLRIVVQNVTLPFEDKVSYFHSNIKSFLLIQYSSYLSACEAGSYIVF